MTSWHATYKSEGILVYWFKNKVCKTTIWMWYKQNGKSNQKDEKVKLIVKNNKCWGYFSAMNNSNIINYK